ncbi:MAG: hypothetical protein ABJA60_11770 [Nitrosospira sp.]
MLVIAVSGLIFYNTNSQKYDVVIWSVANVPGDRLKMTNLFSLYGMIRFLPI